MEEDASGRTSLSSVADLQARAGARVRNLPFIFAAAGAAAILTAACADSSLPELSSRQAVITMLDEEDAPVTPGPQVDEYLRAIAAVEKAWHEEQKAADEEIAAIVSGTKKQRKEATYDRSEESKPPPYPTILPHELALFANSKVKAEAPADKPLEFPLHSELCTIPCTLPPAVRERIEKAMRANNWLQATADGLWCRCCRLTPGELAQEATATATKYLVGKCLPWAKHGQLAQFIDRHVTNTQAVSRSRRRTHREEWQWFKEVERRRIKFNGTGVAAGMITQKSHRDLIVGNLSRTAAIERSVLDLAWIHSHLLPPTALWKAMRERDGQSCASVRASLVPKKNHTGIAVREELQTLLAAQTAARVVKDIGASEYWALMADETSDIKKLSQHGCFVRYLRRATPDSDLEVKVSFVACRPLKGRQGAREIASHLRDCLEAAGVGDWGKCVGACTDGCATMAGERGGVRTLLRRELAHYLMWVWCAAHCLNLAALDACAEHAIVDGARELIGDTYSGFYRGRGEVGRRLGVFRESVATEATNAINGTAYWLDLEMPGVGDTRWCSHDRAAVTLTRVLRGTVLAVTELATRTNPNAKMESLLLKYQNVSNLVGVHLLAVLCPVMSQFSKVLQSDSMCHFDLMSIKEHYVSRLQVIRDRPETEPLYWGCCTAINDACADLPGFVAVQMPFVVAYHRAYAQPYITTVVEKINNRLSAGPTVAALSALFDMRGPIHRPGGDRSLAAGYLNTVVQFYNSPDPPPVPMKYGPFFSHSFVTNLSNDLDRFLDKYKEVAGDETKFTATAMRFLNNRLVRESFPEWTQLLYISLLLPLSNATTERLFSKLKLLKSRLRSSMHDDTLQNSLMINIELEFGDLQGIFDPNVVGNVVDAYTASPTRKFSYASYDDLREAREWVLAWRQSLIDGL